MKKINVNDLGLVLNPKAQKLLCKALFPGEISEESWRKDSGAYVYRSAEKLGLKVLDDFAGVAKAITDDGKDASFGSIGCFGDRMVFCPISRYPSLFSQAYSCMDEIRDEFRGKLGKYLPATFDYALYHIKGVYSKASEVCRDGDFWD